MPQRPGDHIFATGVFLPVGVTMSLIRDAGLELLHLIHCPSFHDLRPAPGSGAFFVKGGNYARE